MIVIMRAELTREDEFGQILLNLIALVFSMTGPVALALIIVTSCISYFPLTRSYNNIILYQVPFESNKKYSDLSFAVF